MQLARRSRFLETEIRSLLSATACQTSAELAQQIQVTREEVLSLLQTLLSDRCVACLQASKGVIYRPYSDPESAVLRALDEAQAPVPLHGIATELPHRVIAGALLALVQVGTVEVEASAGDEPLRYRSVPCALLE